MLLVEKWNRLLEHAPDHVLLIGASGERWSVRSLNDRAIVWSERLRTVPRITGRMIGFSLPNGPDWIGLFIAILRAGGVAMPLDPGGRKSGADALVKSLGGVAHIDGVSLNSWSTSGRKLPPEICLAKITSGSTGAPGRFCFTHSEMDADGRQIESGMGIRPDDINFAVIPFGHSYGLGNFVMPLLRSGVPVALGRSILPQELIADLKATRATVFPAVPPIIHALADADLTDEQLGCIRLVISAGGLLAAESAARFEDRFGLPVHSFYGSTETGGITYDRTGIDTRLGRSVGRPLPGVEIERSPTGRLLVTSRAAFSHANRRRTRAGFGRVLLSDMGQILEDGAIALTGRRRGFLKRAGRRIGLGEVEEVARQVPGIHQARAVVIKSGGMEEMMGLAVETALPVAEVRSALSERLPKWKRPARILCLERFPTTPRGKVATSEIDQLFSRKQQTAPGS